MKKLFLMVSLFAISLTAYSQVGVRFGFTATPGFSWYSPDHELVESEGVRFSLNYGALVDIVLGNNERYAVATGLTINMGGGKLKGQHPEFPDLSSVLTSKVQYLEIPIGLKLRSNETASNLTFYGNLGLINGINIRSRADYIFDGEVDSELELPLSLTGKNVKLKNIPFYPEGIKKVNIYQLGLHFEAGTEFRVSDNTSIVGGLFFRNGFSNVLKDSDNERIVQRGFGFRVAVMF